MRKIYKRVKGKWIEYAPELYWGDDLDVRYYLISKLRRIKNKKILDIGCGAGIILSELDNSNKKYGLDNSKEILKIAKKINNKSANFIVGDFCSLPFKKEEFNIVIAAQVLPGYDFAVKNEKQKRKKMISEIKRVLKKGGILFLTTPNSQNSYYKNKHKIKSMELKELLKDFDYKIYDYNPLPKFLPPKIMVKIPGIHAILNYLTEKRLYKHKGRSFYIEAKNSV